MNIHTYDVLSLRHYSIFDTSSTARYTEHITRPERILMNKDQHPVPDYDASNPVVSGNASVTPGPLGAYPRGVDTSAKGPVLGPGRISRDGYLYTKFGLYELESGNDALILVKVLYAIDVKDAWHRLVNQGYIIGARRIIRMDGPPTVISRQAGRRV